MFWEITDPAHSFMKNCLFFKVLQIKGTDIASILIFFPQKTRMGGSLNLKSL